MTDLQKASLKKVGETVAAAFIVSAVVGLLTVWATQSVYGSRLDRTEADVKEHTKKINATAEDIAAIRQDVWWIRNALSK